MEDRWRCGGQDQVVMGMSRQVEVGWSDITKWWYRGGGQRVVGLDQTWAESGPVWLTVTIMSSALQC